MCVTFGSKCNGQPVADNRLTVSDQQPTVPVLGLRMSATADRTGKKKRYQTISGEALSSRLWKCGSVIDVGRGLAWGGSEGEKKPGRI